MPAASTAADELLAQLCDDLRRLREEANGPSLRALAAEVGLGKSQIGAILNGQVERLPDWDVIHRLVLSVQRHAQDQGRSASLSHRFGIEEYWRRRYSAVEHLLSEPAGPATAPRARPQGLPPLTRHFVGREVELAALTAAAGSVVVTGPAGIGKTTLAVWWAHQAADRFPGGQLYVDLRGFDASGPVMSPIEAIRGFLEALGVPPDRVPASPVAQVSAYRSLLARQGGVLVVLDNARDAEQVRPLLPSAPGCLALVTSRSQLTGLVVSEGIQVLRLDLLSAEESEELLARRLGAQRLRAEKGAVESIVAACARLPLALSVVASRAALQPALSLGALGRELREAPDELAAFRTGDVSTDLRAVFSWSYRELSASAARTLRLLSLTAGGDIAVEAAASLAGAPIGPARHDLAELVDAGLLTEHRPGRYSMHDLLRAYACALVHEVDSPEDCRAARHRLFDHYLHTAHRAAVLIHPPFSTITPDALQPGAAATALADIEAARRWFDAEHPVLLAEIPHADRAGFGRHVWQLTWAVSGYLRRRGMWPQWHELQELGLRAAQRDGDLRGQAHAHRNLAAFCSRTARHDEAQEHLQRAEEQFTTIGDRDGLAHTHLQTGQILERLDRREEALERSRTALDLFTATGNAAGRAYMLNAVGWQLALLGHYRDAISYCEQALERLEDVGDPQGMADTLDSLGYAYHHLGDYAAALMSYERALGMFRSGGDDRYGEASTLENLAESHLALGDTAAARAALQEAWTILDRLGHERADQIRERLDRST